MTTSPPPLHHRDQTKSALNATIAGVFTLLSFWMTVADFSYPGDLLFQTSASFLVSFVVFSLLFTASFIVAIFPKRMIVGLNVLLLCRLSYGFPLSMAMGASTGSRVTSALMLIVSGIYLVCSLKGAIRTGCRPWVQLKNTLVVLSLGILIGVISLPALVIGAGYGVRPLLGSYTELSLEGVTLVERVFEKGGQRVHLVGMMHIGDGSYYRDIKERMNAPLDAGGKRLVLTEGVSDRDELLPRDFANGTTYAKLANALGLEAQTSLKPSVLSDGHTASRSAALPPSSPPVSFEHNGVVWQNADIDISELEAGHQTLLISLLGILSGGNLNEILLADVGDATGEDLEDLFKNGLIIARNQVLMDRFDAMGSEFSEVYIPWGAAHLPDVEERLIERGYQQVSEIKRPVVAFWK